MASATSVLDPEEHHSASAPARAAKMDRLLHATARAEARHFWFRGFRLFVTPLVRSATEGRSDVRILDCGCGTGANVDLLARFGRAYGFDLTESGLRFGREAGRTRLARATVTSVPFPTAFFDLVTSFDVIYALEERDERDALAEMFRLLKPGGHAIVNVAAMKSLRGDHSVLGHEVRRYSRDRLRASMTAAGFTIVRLTHTNATLTPPLMLMRAFQRWRGLRPESGELAVPPTPINTLLTGLLRVESWWLRSFDLPFGSSLLCLAQKPKSRYSPTR